MSKHSAQGNRRILIVDDNPAIHDDFKKILAANVETTELDELGALVLGDEVAEDTRAQYELTSAYQGQEALELVRRAVAKNEPFALAFVDMRMPPGWNGLVTIERIWQADPHLQIVICTAFSDYSWSEIIRKIAYRNQLLILKKPFDNAEVCQLSIALTEKWDLERASQERMRSIVETAPDGIITFGADGVIESCNTACCELLGYAREELVGSNVARILPATQVVSNAAAPRELPEVGVPARGEARDVDARRKDGTLVPVLVSMSQFVADGGTMYTAIFRDLSEQRRLQGELAQAQKLEAIGQLAAGIAHEINTPMQFISDNIEFLSECSNRLFEVVDGYQRNLFLTETHRSWAERKRELETLIERNHFESIRREVPEAITESLEGIQRVIHIVQAMKEFSHPGLEEKVGLDLNNAIHSTVTLTRNRWKYVAEMDLELDPDLPTLNGVPADVNQVLLNLIVNAADAIAEKFGQESGDKGRIAIRTRADDQAVVVEVDDNGAGIPQEIQGRIFEPFFTTKDVGRGTGQGLAICYNLVVREHRGKIEVESTPGEGSVFRVILPRRPIEHVDAGTEEATSKELGELAVV